MSDQLHLQALQALTVAVNKIVQALGGSFTLPISPDRGGTGIANNAASTLTITGNYATALTVSTTTVLTLPATGTLATLAGVEELTNKTLTSSVAKGTWTTSGTWTLPALTLGGAITYGGVTLTNAVTGTGKMVLDASPTIATPVINSAAHVGGTWVADATWTLPAFTLGGTVSGGGQQLNNIIIGTSTPLAGSFTTVGATGAVTARSGTATPAAASAVAALAMGTTPMGIYFGSGSPDTALTAPKGSLYLRSDGGGVNDRAYINTDASTAWTAVVTVA